MHSSITNHLTVLSTLAIVGLVGAATATYLYYVTCKRSRKSRQIPEQWTSAGKVQKLHLYPLKSGKKIDLTSAECTVVGLKQTKTSDRALQLYDRSFVVYDEGNHEYRTARTYPKMVLIEISVHDDGHVAFDAPGMRPLYVEIPQENDKNNMKIALKEERIYSLDCGDEAASWFSRYIKNQNSGLRLGYHNADLDKRRDISKTHSKMINVFKELNSKSTGLYSDLSSVMLVNQESVDDLNQKIPGTKVTSEHFRPNVIMRAPAYQEDKWEWVKIGDAIFRNVKPCTRCVFTTINPVNGVKSEDGEPLTTLKTYRLFDDPKEREMYPTTPIMGINLECVQLGNIKVNDEVFVA